MTKITVIEFIKFNSIKKDFEYTNAYRNGYWNVFRYTEQLERFLIDNNIKFEVR